MRSLIALLGLALLVGCLEMQKETVNAPPKTSCESVEASLNQSIVGSEKYLQTEDWVHYEETVAATSQPETIVLDQVRKIIKLIPLGAEGEKFYEARLFETNITYKDGKAQTETKETMEDAPTVYSLCPISPAVSFFGLQGGGGPVDVRQYKDNCGSYANCQMRVSQVNFDQLVAMSDGSFEAVKYRFVFSTEVPYFARVLEMCVTQSYELNGQKIPVTRCRRVKNFGFKGE